MKTTLNENDRDEITKLLVGRRVEKVDAETLLLDNGTRLKLGGNNGGCSCGAGDYELTHLSGVDNVITNVEFDDQPGGDDAPSSYEGAYRIFVFADNERINLATFEGSDGNGYYGTGYWIEVESPDAAMSS